ncbi:MULTISPECIES: hypothetical protein [unclassified Mesorhizobium]
MKRNQKLIALGLACWTAVAVLAGYLVWQKPETLTVDDVGPIHQFKVRIN